MKGKKVVKTLKVSLSETELNEKAKKLVEYLQEQGKVTLDKKLANDEFKKQLEAIAHEISILCECIESKSEKREIECIESKNYEKNQKEYFSLDTGEILAATPMNQDDLQEEVDFED